MQLEPENPVCAFCGHVHEWRCDTYVYIQHQGFREELCGDCARPIACDALYEICAALAPDEVFDWRVYCPHEEIAA